MIPPFGFREIERLACILMGFAGVVALAYTRSAVGENGVHPRPYILVLQSLAVIAGALGAWRSNSFILTAIGIASSLMVWTPVGRICFLPGLLMFFLVLGRFRSFSIFLPRWRGPGPPPPG